MKLSPTVAVWMMAEGYLMVNLDMTCVFYMHNPNAKDND